MPRRIRPRLVPSRSQHNNHRPGFDALETRVTPAIVTPFTIPPLQVPVNPLAIVRVDDGSLWFSTAESSTYVPVIGRVGVGGAVSEIPLNPGDSVSALTTTPNGDLVFIISHDDVSTTPVNPSLGKITPAGVFSERTFPDGESPTALAVGPDGDVWFGLTGTAYDALGRIGADGVITTYPTPKANDITSLVTGADGILRYEGRNTEGATVVDVFGQVSPTGTITETPLVLGQSDVYLGDLILGPDGNFWAESSQRPAIDRITPDGILTRFLLPDPDDWVTHLTDGPDGNLWFSTTEDNPTTHHISANPEIDRITTDGVVTRFAIPSGDSVTSITPGPDGNIWFTTAGGETTVSGSPSSSVGRITPEGTVTEFAGPGSSDGNDAYLDTFSTASTIASGPDGDLWFLGPENLISRITPGGTLNGFPIPTAPAVVGNQAPGPPISGPDGALWYADAAGVGRITTGGVATQFAIPKPATTALVDGPDGALWFGAGEPEPGLTAATELERITTDGDVTEFPLPANQGLLAAPTSGPDGDVWFTAETVIGYADQYWVGRVTPGGTMTEFAIPEGAPNDQPLTIGPDGNLWFAANGFERYPSPTDTASWAVRVTPAGVVTEFATPTGQQIDSPAVVGPDGDLWFTEQSPDIDYDYDDFAGLENGDPHNDLVRVTPDGVVTEFPYANLDDAASIPPGDADGYFDTPGALAVGPDGNLWFIQHTVTEFTQVGDDPNPSPQWPHKTADQIFRMTPDGVLLPTIDVSATTPLSTPDDTGERYPDYYLSGLILGSDGSMWSLQSANEGSTVDAVRVSTDGEITDYALPADTILGSPTIGPDGNLWYNGPDLDLIARLNLDGLAPPSGITTPDPIDAEIGQAISAPLATIAATDLRPADIASVSIDWGDDTPPSAGTAVVNAQGGLDIVGTHTYSFRSTYPMPDEGTSVGKVLAVEVTLTHTDGSISFATGSVTIVGELGAATGLPISGVARSPFTVEVATIDSPLSEVAGSYIDWGDGTPASAATLTADGSDRTVITAGHDYAAKGSYVVEVDIGGTDDSLVSTQITATIAENPVSAVGPLSTRTVTAYPGDATENVLATFGNGVIADYVKSVEVDWGDGSHSNVPVSTLWIDAKGQLVLSAGHAYGDYRSYPIGIQVVGIDGKLTTASTTATVTAHPVNLIPQSPFQGVARVLSAVTPVVIAYAPTSWVDLYALHVDWGDGTSLNIDPTAFEYPNDPYAYGLYTYIGHAYESPGTYRVVEVASGHDGLVSTVATTAIVAPNPVPLLGPLTALPIVSEAQSAFDGTVATISGTTTVSDIESVHVDWGDGTSSDPSPTSLAAVAGGGLALTLGHEYARAWTYPVVVQVVGADGSVETASTTATVAPLPGVAGSLDPASDSGVSSHDGVTDVNRPVFLGTAAPGATVSLFARVSGSSATIPIGQVVANASGQWAVTSDVLADGSYAITATTDDGLGQSTTTAIGTGSADGTLVIDTAAPLITGLTLNPLTGRLNVTVSDVGGFTTSGFRNALAYQFGRSPAHPNMPVSVTSITDAPGPTGTATVVLTINGGKPLPTGRYPLTILPGAVVDTAGNATAGLDATLVSGGGSAVTPVVSTAAKKVPSPSHPRATRAHALGRTSMSRRLAVR